MSAHCPKVSASWGGLCSAPNPGGAAASLFVVAPYNKNLACDRIASLRHGSRVRPPLPLVL